MLEKEFFTLLSDSGNRTTELAGSGRAWLGTIMYRVNQALDRMDMSYVKLLYIDETSFKRSHSYITLICDQDRRIIFVCEGKSSETMDRLAV